MWPFRKKTSEPEPSPLTDAECREMRRRALQELSNFKPTGLMSYWDIKKRLRAQKERPMKLEVGKWYDVEGLGVLQCTERGYRYDPSGPIGVGYKIGEYYYWDNMGNYAWPKLLRESPAPLRLEVGKLYETTAGVQVCHLETQIHNHNYPYRLGSYYYDISGRPYKDLKSPRILYKLRVNEHMDPSPRYADTIRIKLGESDSGKLFQDLVKEAEMSMEHLTPAMARTLRPVLDEIIARHEARQPTPVRYKPHTDCSKREPIVPDGWERVPTGSIRTTDMRMPGDDGFWRGVPHALTPFCPVIRPKPAPFRLTGAGWYKTLRGDWIKDPNTTTFDRYFQWDEAGRYLPDNPNQKQRPMDLIAKATPAQAKVLEAL